MPEPSTNAKLTSFCLHVHLRSQFAFGQVGRVLLDSLVIFEFWVTDELFSGLAPQHEPCCEVSDFEAPQRSAATRRSRLLGEIWQLIINICSANAFLLAALEKSNLQKLTN